MAFLPQVARVCDGVFSGPSDRASCTDAGHPIFDPKSCGLPSRIWRLQEVRSIHPPGQLHLGRCLSTFAFANSVSTLAAKQEKDKIGFAKFLAFLIGFDRVAH